MKNNEQHRQEWAARLADYSASGLTMAAWCSANQRSMDQLKYWLRKFKNAPATEAVSVPLCWTPLATNDAPAVNATPLIVHVGPSRIELHPGFDPGLLRSVVQALQPLC